MTRLSRRVVLLGIILTAGGALGSDVEAQRARPIKIGALTESWGATPGIIGLRDGLQELGYRENEDFVIGVRFTQGKVEDLPAAARDLVQRGVDVIVTGEGGNTARAAQMATQQIPIVFIGGNDPVGTGLVKSFAAPGGNVTGIADLDADLGPKRLELFRELVAGLKRVLIVYDATNPAAIAQATAGRDAARNLGLTLIERPVRTEAAARAVIAAARKHEVDGILAPRFLSLNIPGFVLAAHKTLPTMFQGGEFFVQRGGLASYSANDGQSGRQAARLVDKILRGARPAELPVEQPTKFDLLINVSTAKGLGLTIPQSMLLRADRLIQ
jgi:putative ABC transport system substrate-binding protein